MTWSEQQVNILIQEFKKHPCLFAVKSKIFKNKHARIQALESVRSEVVKQREGVTVADIKTKFNGLKANFMNEYRKVLSSHQKSGNGAEDLYHPTIYYYKSMEFVLEHNDHRPAYDSIEIHEDEENAHEIEDSFEDFDGMLSENVDEEEFLTPRGSGIRPRIEREAPPNIPRVPRESNKRKRVVALNRPQDEFFQNAADVFSRMSGSFSTTEKPNAYGSYVEEKLNQIIDKELRLEAEHEINQVLYKYIKESMKKLEN